MTREAYTIESLDKRKRELDKRISQCEESISLKWHTLFAPPEADTKMQRWVNQVLIPEKSDKVTCHDIY